MRFASVKRHLFIDDEMVDTRQGVMRVVNQPRLAGPVVEPGTEGAYDDAYVGCFGQIIEENGLYRLWVNGRAAKILAADFGEGDALTLPTGYYTSTDGIHWKAPSLGLFEWNGSRDNNIVNLDYGYVFLDPKPRNDQELYKFLCTGRMARGVKNVYDALHPEAGGLYFYTSSDGIHWDWRPERILAIHPDCCNQIIYDTRLERHVAYLRCWPHHFMHGKTYGRAVARLELDELMAPWPVPVIDDPCHPWGPDKIADPSTEYPIVMRYPGYDEDGHWTDIYDPNVIQYPWADGVYLAFPELNHFLPESEMPNHSKLEIGMCVSRDGIQWDWPSLDAYIPFGEEGDGRTGMLFSLQGMIRSGDEIFQYHFGTSIEHHGFLKKAYGYEKLLNSGRIYRTVQRFDGFVSLDAAADGGEIVTKPFVFAGETLRLNLKADGGSAVVSILDEQGMPVPGYAPEDSLPIDDDSVGCQVSWKSGRSISCLQGRPIRLQFRLNDAKLFAFEFSDT